MYARQREVVSSTLKAYKTTFSGRNGGSSVRDSNLRHSSKAQTNMLRYYVVIMRDCLLTKDLRSFSLIEPDKKGLKW